MSHLFIEMVLKHDVNTLFLYRIGTRIYGQKLAGIWLEHENQIAPLLYVLLLSCHTNLAIICLKYISFLWGSVSFHVAYC